MSAVKKIVGRPVEAESFLWTGDNFADIPAAWRELDIFEEEADGILTVRTKRGPVPCFPGEHIIHRRSQEFYPTDVLSYEERWAER